MDSIESLADTVAGICRDMKRKYDDAPSNSKKRATRVKKMLLLKSLHPDKNMSIMSFPPLVEQFTEATKKINDILVDF